MQILVVGRVLQGLGAGAIPAVAYVAIGRALPERLRAADVRDAVDGVGPARRASGRPSPAVVAEAFHWRLVFLGLLPLIAVAAAMTVPAIARDPGRPAAAEGEHDVAVDTRRRLPLAILLTIGAGLTSPA